MAMQSLIENISRRRFLQAAGLVVAVQVLSARSASAYYKTGSPTMPEGPVTNDPHLLIAIDPTGTVTITSPRSEMGQGIRTSLAMIIADEMGADWSRVRIIQGLADERFGNQDTDGSHSLRHSLQPMRQAGAAMRQMLAQAAAQSWGVTPVEVEVGVHEIVHKPSGRKLDFGKVAKAAMDLPVPPLDQIQLKPDSALRYVGKAVIKPYDQFNITVGKAVYGYDVRLPNMKYAVIARPPVVGGKVKSFDAADAMKIPGVEKVLQMPGEWQPPAKYHPLGGVAVVATNTWAAMQGREALKIEWDDGANAAYDSATYKQQLFEGIRKPAKITRDEGDVDKSFASAAQVISSEFYVPHLSCSPMEPPAATAVVADGKCDLWAPLQYLYNARTDVSKLLGMPIENVTVHCTLLGGGFGRKAQCDFAQEAVLLSREMGGAPVKVSWTREDDIHHSFFHAVSAHRLEAAIDDKGKVTGLRYRTAAPSLMSNFLPDSNHEAPLELAMGEVDMPFDVRNIRVENGEAPAMTRIGWFRSVINIPSAFAIQSFVAELAHSLGKDHKDFLIELIGPPRQIDIDRIGLKDPYWNYGDPYETYPIDTGRLINVINIAAQQANWGRQMPKGRGLGIAAHRSFLTYVASVVEVAVDADGNVTIPRVDTAIDCGFPVNLERIQSQMEGAAVMATSSTMFSKITFKAGRVEQNNYDSYEVARIETAPLEVHTHIVPHGFETPASGVGEPGVPPFAPALCNAIFAATGKRIRSLPIKDQDLKSI